MRRIGWMLAILIFAPIVLIVLGVIGTELNKAYWDRQVIKLCEKEGGVTVYKIVMLTEEEFLELGGIHGKPLSVPIRGSRKSSKNPKFPYEMTWETVEIRARSPQVWKSKMKIYSKYDGQVLGQYISFTRRGGDFPTGMAHDSSFSCRDTDGFVKDFEGKIFIIKGE